ncbi:MAG TPA: ATP-binding cassette domain-containing protein [Thermoanaerobaculia bacterium]|nr:ATP-binding cassette domain-containing protein [Thermoanaerobaculia bacterium]
MSVPDERRGPAAYELRSTVLAAHGISLRLGGAPILRDVDLEVRDVVRPGTCTGQVVALLGPSGVGKTTLFRVLAGLQHPDSGTVLIGSPGVPVERGMVGVVAQNYPLFAHRSVLGNLVVAGRRAGQSRQQARARATEMLSRFDLLDRASLYPAQLSGGQRQRVAIAQQFMCSEHFLLLDEPFSGLDPIAVEKVAEMLVEVANLDELNTVIVVTHDINAALEVADVVWLLGRDRDPAGAAVPGARIQETYDLMECGLAWHKGIGSSPRLLEMAAKIRARFALL